MLDAFTSAMYNEPWGRIWYARALIEVSAEKELKKEVIMVVPLVNGEGHIKETMFVDYEWTPPRCMDCQVFGHVASECPKRVVEPAEEVQEVQPDGFTTVKNRKKKGKKVDVDKNRHIVGLKLNKPGPKYAWNVKSNSAASKDTTKKDDASQDSESEVKELESGFDTKTDNHNGESTPSDEVVSDNHLSICAILESHVDISALSTVCSKVFRIWDWTSNASLCNKGCRNNPIERRLLLAELGLHKNMVQGAPWILMGDFNVALNMEDSFPDLHISRGFTTSPSRVLSLICIINSSILDYSSIFDWQNNHDGNSSRRIVANFEDPNDLLPYYL
ncbi:trichome birefringence-like protein 3 [Tanacetum coccineum]